MQRASDIAFEFIYWFLRGTDFEFTYKSFLELLEGIDSIKVHATWSTEKEIWSVLKVVL